MEAPRYEGFTPILLGLVIFSAFGLWKVIELANYVITHLHWK